jgi:hypothetical protein
MKKRLFSIPLLAVIFCAGYLFSGQEADLLKKYPIVSVYYSVPDNDQRNFADVVFRFGWSKKPTSKIAIQFVNRGYSDRKLKFAIKDVTSKKMVVLDTAHNSRFGTEMLKANSTGAIWSGLVDDINDKFSLRVWDSAGDEFDKVPICIKDQQ